MVREARRLPMDVAVARDVARAAVGVAVAPRLPSLKMCLVGMRQSRKWSAWREETSKAKALLSGLEAEGLADAKAKKSKRKNGEPDLETEGLAGAKPLAKKSHRKSVEPDLETEGLPTKPLAKKSHRKSVEPDLETEGLPTKPLAKKSQRKTVEPDLETEGLADAKPLTKKSKRETVEPDVPMEAMSEKTPESTSKSAKAKGDKCKPTRRSLDEELGTCADEGEKQTFARRFKPTCEKGLSRWLALRDAFEEHVKPAVHSPSRHEAREFETYACNPCISKGLLVVCMPLFWEFLCCLVPPERLLELQRCQLEGQAGDAGRASQAC